MVEATNTCQMDAAQVSGNIEKSVSLRDHNEGEPDTVAVYKSERLVRHKQVQETRLSSFAIFEVSKSRLIA